MRRNGVLHPARLTLHLLVAALLWAALSRPAQAGVSFSFFYSNLEPHGSWLVSGQYGRVWQPSVYAPGWHPYYDGHWVYSDVGWAWVSDYHWGAVPYHYGTWVLDPYLGWVWVPGYVWAPAWVVFSTGPDHIGWCPVPVGYSIGAHLSYADLHAPGFVFVGTRHFLAPRIGVYAVPATRTKVVLSRTKIVNRIALRGDMVVNPGPDVVMVEKARGRGIKPVPIESIDRIAPSRMGREDLRAGSQARSRELRAAEPRRAASSAPATRAARSASDRNRTDTVWRQDTSRREGAVPRDRAMRENPPRRAPDVERSSGSQVGPKRKPSGQQVAKPGKQASEQQARVKPGKKPEKKPPARPAKEDGERGNRGPRDSR